MTPLRLAKIIAKAASQKKAEDIVVLDMRKIANFCDFFVLCNGSSGRQLRAIANGIDEVLDKEGMKVSSKQGFQHGQWIVLDLGTVVTHIFDGDAREFYGLDYLWQEAKKVNWKK